MFNKFTSQWKILQILWFQTLAWLAATAVDVLPSSLMTCLYYKYPPCWAVKSLFRPSAGSDSYLGQRADVTWSNHLEEKLQDCWREFLNKEKQGFVELMALKCHKHVISNTLCRAVVPVHHGTDRLVVTFSQHKPDSKQACCPLQWLKLQSLNAHQCKCVFAWYRSFWPAGPLFMPPEAQTFCLPTCSWLAADWSQMSAAAAPSPAC